MTRSSRPYDRVILQRVILGGLSCASLFLWWLGTATGPLPVATTQIPACALTRASDGTKAVVCTMHLDYPAEHVWSVITDYQKFPDIFRSNVWWIDTLSIENQSESGATISGAVSTWGVSFPFTTQITHRIEDDTRIAEWDQRGSGVDRNRGSWRIERSGETSSVATYSLEVVISPFPQFLVNDCLLLSVPGVMDSLRSYLFTRPR